MRGGATGGSSHARQKMTWVYISGFEHGHSRGKAWQGSNFCNAIILSIFDVLPLIFLNPNRIATLSYTIPHFKEPLFQRRIHIFRYRLPVNSDSV